MRDFEIANGIMPQGCSVGHNETDMITDNTN